MTTPDALRARLKSDLVAAMKARETDRVATLRTALAAIDNAEAITPSGAASEATSAHVAGSTVGVGATESDRRTLTLDDVHGILRAQIDEHLADAGLYDRHGRPDEAERLREAAATLSAYLTAP